ncbi:MAG: hypothetical protein LBP72_08015 [Dysgonamonadaceae bacterium]|nr:hypothetical protein [Dysgonamonadaceae bacterium]
MAQTIGIQIEHNERGIPTFARIDLSKYGHQLKDFFASQGIVIEKKAYDIPNTETLHALNEAHTKKLKTYENADALLADLYR